LPDGLNEALSMVAPWEYPRVVSRLPVDAFQTVAEPAPLEVTISVPFGLKAAV
jgi:hypothetical protein